MKALLVCIILGLFVVGGCGGTFVEQAGECLAEQGVMAGEVTTNSVILQGRLTGGIDEVTGDVLGCAGVGRFEVLRSLKIGDSFSTKWIKANEANDFIVKVKVDGLEAGKRYWYKLEYGKGRKSTKKTMHATFETLGGKDDDSEKSFVVVTGMNYSKFHNPKSGYKGDDRLLGYPALVAMMSGDSFRTELPDFFVGTGDNVYFDKPPMATTQEQIRGKYHEQFVQQRFVKLFANVPTYWEKDDHDHRYNDCDRSSDKLPSSELGIATFKEQLPVVDPADENAVTYRTHRISKHLQIWLVEGRDYRSDNDIPDGPDKTLWGAKQIAWLKRTLTESDATFKILISPTPMVGPDDAYKKDNHTNMGGFQHEGKAFFKWLKDSGVLAENFYIICGDRHWQYHSVHPSGIEEFSCGALVDVNSRIGRKPGDKKSTDPGALIKQPYCMQKPSGGFLHVTVNKNKASFTFYDEKNNIFYACGKDAVD